MFVALVIQHAMRMRRIILASVACPALPSFSTLFRKRHEFRRNVIEDKTFVLIFSKILYQTAQPKKNTVTYYTCTSVLIIM
jgi:hypothetical protein